MTEETEKVFKRRSSLSHIRPTDIIIWGFMFVSIYNVWFDHWDKANYYIAMVILMLLLRLTLAIGNLLLSLQSAAMEATSMLSHAFTTMDQTLAEHEVVDDDHPGMYL